MIPYRDASQVCLDGCFRPLRGREARKRGYCYVCKPSDARDRRTRRQAHALRLQILVGLVGGEKNVKTVAEELRLSHQTVLGHAWRLEEQAAIVRRGREMTRGYPWIYGRGPRYDQVLASLSRELQQGEHHATANALAPPDLAGGARAVLLLPSQAEPSGPDAARGTPDPQRVPSEVGAIHPAPRSHRGGPTGPLPGAAGQGARHEDADAVRDRPAQFPGLLGGAGREVGAELPLGGRGRGGALPQRRGARSTVGGVPHAGGRVDSGPWAGRGLEAQRRPRGDADGLQAELGGADHGDTAWEGREVHDAVAGAAPEDPRGHAALPGLQD